MGAIITILLTFLTQYMDVVHDAANFDVLTNESRQIRIIDEENDLADRLYRSFSKEEIDNFFIVKEETLFRDPQLSVLDDDIKDILRILLYRLRQREYYDEIATRVVDGYSSISDSMLSSFRSPSEKALLVEKEVAIYRNLESLEFRKITSPLPILTREYYLKKSIRSNCRNRKDVLKVLQLKTTGFKGASAPSVSEKTEAAFHRFGNDRIKNHRKELLRGRDADIFDEEPILSRRRMTTK